MKEIEQNPFRILGLPITASAREIEKQIGMLETYADMGKAISVDTDFSFLAPVERTPEAIGEAKRRIQLDEQKFFYSLFWFWNNNTVDDLAFDLLAEGKVDKAKDIWEKAVFANRKKTYKPELVVANLITESTAWPENATDDYRFSKDGGEYTIATEIDITASIPVVWAGFGKDDRNWSIECDAEWMAGYDADDFGIIFGRDDSDYFSFTISGDGYFRYGKTTNWDYEDLVPWTASDSIIGLESNHLQITKLDGNLGFYINGTLVCSHPSEALFGNNFGFKVMGEQTVIFRNFKVTEMVESDPSTYEYGIVVTKKNFSCVKNLSLLYWSHSVSGGTLKQPAMENAVALANRFFLDEQIEAYSKLVAGDRYRFDRKKALDFYLTTLVDSLKGTLDRTYGVSTSTFIKAFSEFPNSTGTLVKNKFVGKTIQDLSKLVEKAESGRRANPGDGVTFGKKLIENAGKHIDYLNDVLGDDDFEYQVIADKIAYEVVQCGIDYYNSTKNDEPCLSLYQYGRQVAATDRCREWAQENFESCVSSGSLTKIYRLLEQLRKELDGKPHLAISAGKELAEKAKPELQYLRETLGETNPEYMSIADLLSRAAIQCAIEYFNTSKNDELGLSLYRYAYATAATAEAKKWAKENLDSCNEWIETKVYRLCFFCGRTPPESSANITRTMYKETYRSSFARRVEFSYGDVTIPRCGDCKILHRKISTYTTMYTGTIIVCAAVGSVAGFAASPDAYKLGVALILGLIGLTGGWLAAKYLITPVDSDGIKPIGEATQYPSVADRIAKGWTFSKPSA